MCWHKWGKWKEYMWVGKVQAHWKSEAMIDTNHRRQKRVCEKCGYTQDYEI